VVLWVILSEEGVYLLDSVPVVSFCRQVKSSLLRIPHSLAVLNLNIEVGSKDGRVIVGFSFVWPDATTSSSSRHVEARVLYEYDSDVFFSSCLAYFFFDWRFCLFFTVYF
jgi:hypothetical protein